MLDRNAFPLKDFLKQAIDLNSCLIKLKIESEAESLLPYENNLRRMKSGDQNLTCSSKVQSSINTIIRLKNDLKKMQKLTEMIESAGC